MKVEITVIIAVDLKGYLTPEDVENLVVSIPEDEIRVFKHFPSFELERTILGYETTSCEILDED